MEQFVSRLMIEHRADGATARLMRPLAVEAPVAVEFNGIGYAVMMMTPADLEDFATGFALAERIAQCAADVIDAGAHETGEGIVLRIALAARCNEAVLARVRHRASESSCGLCGIETLEQALRPLPPVTNRCEAAPDAVFRAREALSAYQPLSDATGAVHAAALCSAGGAIRLVREDVGRHNAFDKLIGAMAREGLGWDRGFALLTARCSFELVEKAVLANCPMLATISAPTSLAVERAEQAGLKLCTLARADSFLSTADE